MTQVPKFCCFLCNRLEDYDRNFNFGQNVELEAEYTMTLPAVLSYKDMNSDSVVPKLSCQAVSTYLQSCDKKMDKISTELYSGGYINFIRFAKAGDFYFKAECRAQMKARMSYAVDVCINESGTIQELSLIHI